MGVYDHGNVLGTQTVLLERIAELFLTVPDHVVKLLIIGWEVSDSRVYDYGLFLSPDEQRFQSSLVLCALIFSEDEKALVQREVAVAEQSHINNSQFEIISTRFLRGYKLSRVGGAFETSTDKLSRSIWTRSTSTSGGTWRI